jgi:outer membrane autotransporter protein
MGGSNRHSTARAARSTCRNGGLAVAPIARAIRVALAVSATTLALSTPVMAAPPPLAPSTPVMAAPVPAEPFDLTRVEDAQPPASVVPVTAAGFRSGATLVADNTSPVHLVSAYTAYVDNYGSVDATAEAGDGEAAAAGLYAFSYQTTRVRNYGDVSAVAESTGGDATAYGAFAFGGFTGSALVINGGDIESAAVAGAGANAYAAGAIAEADVASLFNDAGIGATATAGTGGTAYAMGARAYGVNSGLYIYGDVTAVADADAGVATAFGAHAYGYQSAGFLNAGDIEAGATAAGGTAAATGAYVLGVIYGAYATNSGAISAVASGDSATATGVSNAAIYLGEAITTNSGDISAVAEGGIAPYGEAEAIATGAYNFSLFYDSIVDNSGTISAAASATADLSGTNGFLQAKAIGAHAVGGYGYLDAMVTNAGDISASAAVSQGYASAWAAVARSGGTYGGDAVVRNDGSLQAYGHADVGIAYATGAYAMDQVADASVVNYGDVVALARVETGRGAGTYGYGVLNYVYAAGVAAKSVYGGDAYVGNHGSIQAHASALGAITGARGIQAYGNHDSIVTAEGASIVAVGDVDKWGAGRATGIDARGHSAVDVVNDGSVVAYGHSRGYSYNAYETHYSVAGTTGIYAGAGFYGSVSVTNNGDIAARSVGDDTITFFNGGAGATGIDTYAKYDADIVNAGDVAAVADSELGIVTAYGVVGHGKYSTGVSNLAGASIVASATAGSLYSDAYGGRSFAAGVRVFGSGMQQGTVYNAGSIAASATVAADGGANANRSIATAYGASVGAYSSILDGSVVNRGDISAGASADFGYATAYGSFVQARYHADTSNEGAIAATASASAGDAWAVGSFGFALHGTLYVPCDGYTCDYSNAVYTPDAGETTLSNGGDIAAAAHAAGGTAHAYGAVAIGGFAAGITNAGHIGADADGGDAFAYGSLVNSLYGGSTLGNSGAIAARARGDAANATGVSIIAHGDGTATVDNSGAIAAFAYGDGAVATAVSMASTGGNALSNSGTIAAFGDGARIAVASGADAAATIDNAGTITGAIVTGDLDDGFANAAGAIWNAVGESDFGAGDDRIVNHGAIFMDDATIRLGGYAAAGNAFENHGLIGVSGNDTIDMDNPLPVVNDGIISFLDGATDDTLAIAGDLAGHGTIVLDASAANASADRLHIEGSITGEGTQAIAVHLVDSVVRASTGSIALVQVDGDSDAGDFTLGGVSVAPGGFLSLGFDLHEAGAGMLALGVDVTGLNGSGSLAAAMAPGVASLVGAQVGSLRQRMGVMPEQGATGVSSWLRWYGGSGGVDARHDANFGAGGDFGFHQSNNGWELGVDYRPSERLAFGVLLGKSDGSQRLGEGPGSDRLDGDTVGVYGTWTGDNGVYVDLSQRRVDVDALLRADGGEVRGKTTGDAFNVELGVAAWTLARLKASPQLQYTRTRIDGFQLRDAGSVFAAHGATSSRARLGVAFERSFAAGGFTLVPYGSINAVHEFDGGYGYAVNGGLAGTTRTDGTSAMLELGLGARKGGLSLTGSVEWTDGGAQQRVLGGQLSVRYGW